MAEQEAEATQRGEAPLLALGAAFEGVRKTQAAQALAMDALEKAFDAEKATLYAQKRALAADVAQFQDEQKRARLAAPPADEVVKLNVGGVHFETSRGVLTRVEDSMLGRMFARNDAPKDPTDGSIFIDRDGARFGMLLDFLRGDPPNDRAMRASLAALPQLTGAAMLQEIEYFGLQNAVFGSRPWTVSATFRAGPEMREGRSFFASVNAGNRVIVFGGSLDGSELFTTEVLDVETLQFSNGPDLAKGITEFAAVTLDADRVLVVGGINGAGEYPTATEILTLSTLTLSPGPTFSGRSGCAAVQIDADRVLVVGGNDGAAQLATTMVLDVATLTFARGPTMTTARSGCAAIALDGKRILIAGGSNADSGRLTTTEFLDVASMSFAPGPSMSTERWGCAAVLVDAQHVLIVGGRDNDDVILATTEILDLVTMSFSPGPHMMTARHGSVAQRLDYKGEAPVIMVIGGEDDSGYHSSTTEALAVDLRTADPGARATRRRT